MTKTTFIKIARWVFTLFTLAMTVLFLYKAFNLSDYGANYTEEYTVYKDIKTMNTVDEVKTYLKEKKLEYEISDNLLTIYKFDYVECKIVNENLQLVKSSHMEKFEELDTHNTSTITTKGVLKDNEIVEKYSSFAFHDFIKIDNNYYIRPTLLCLIHSVILGSITWILFPVKLGGKKKKKAEAFEFDN